QATGRSLTPLALGDEARSILAAREIRSTLAALQAAGAQARYLAIDVLDGAALAGALDDVRSSWGPIAGIIHGAGVLADKSIGEKTEEQFERVFAPTVRGLQ